MKKLSSLGSLAFVSSLILVGAAHADSLKVKGSLNLAGGVYSSSGTAQSGGSAVGKNTSSLSGSGVTSTGGQIGGAGNKGAGYAFNTETTAAASNVSAANGPHFSASQSGASAGTQGGGLVGSLNVSGSGKGH